MDRDILKVLVIVLMFPTLGVQEATLFADCAVALVFLFFYLSDDILALLFERFSASVEVVLIKELHLVKDGISPLKPVDDQWITSPHIEELVDLDLEGLLLLLTLSFGKWLLLLGVEVHYFGSLGLCDSLVSDCGSHGLELTLKFFGSCVGLLLGSRLSCLAIYYCTLAPAG